MNFFLKKRCSTKQSISKQSILIIHRAHRSKINVSSIPINNVDSSHVIYHSGKPAALKNEAVPVAVPVMPPLSNSFARSQRSPFATTPTVADNFECSSNVSGMFEIIHKLETFSFFSFEYSLFRLFC